MQDTQTAIDNQQELPIITSSLLNRFVASLIVMSAAIFLFTPLGSLLLATGGLLVLLSSKNVKAFYNQITHPLILATGCLVALMFMHYLTGPKVAPFHDTIHSSIRWLIFIPFITLGLALKDCVNLERIMTSLIIGVVLYAITAFIETHGGFYFSSLSDTMSHMHHHNNAQPLVIAYVCATLLLFRRIIDSVRSKDSIVSLMTSLAFLFMIYTIFSQEERIGYVVLFIMTPLVMRLSMPSRKHVIALFSGFVVIFALVCVFNPFNIMFDIKDQFGGAVVESSQYIKGDSQAHLGSIGARIDGIRWALANIKQRPLLGYGMGAFQYDPTKETRQLIIPPTGPHPSVEVYYLHVILNLGLIGFVVFMFIFYQYLITMRRCINHLPLRHDCYIIILSVYLGALTFPLFDFNTGLVLYALAASITCGALFRSKVTAP